MSFLFFLSLHSLEPFILLSSLLSLSLSLSLYRNQLPPKNIFLEAFSQISLLLSLFHLSIYTISFICLLEFPSLLSL